MQNIKIAPTFFITKNVVKMKNVKKRDINKKRKKRFLHLCCKQSHVSRVCYYCYCYYYYYYYYPTIAHIKCIQQNKLQTMH